jgi:hypothetical protein
MSKTSLLAPLLLTTLVGPVSAQTPAGVPASAPRTDQQVTAVRATGPITLDGSLNEPSWQQAQVARAFRQSEPREGQPATYDTEVRLVYDADALYIGVRANDPDPGKLVVTDLKKDYVTDASDQFAVLLDTFHDSRNGYEFATNPAGAKWDAQMANEGKEINANWDGIWDVRTRVVEDGWIAEIRIPFRTLKFNSADVQSWGINFKRKIRRLNEDTYWAPVPRIYGLERASLAGTVDGMQGVKPGKNIRIKPYIQTSRSEVAGRATVGDAQVGLDVKYGVTSGLVWDFTVNTDFSQVEADEQQVNLTRFNLFFPEKRDFFLENSGVFQFGAQEGGFGGGFGGGAIVFPGRQNGTQDMRLFFSRRIGLSDAGQAIPILGGTRLSGREGRYSVGLLNIQQRRDSGVPATNFTAIRVKRDVLANSEIGAVLLNKDEVGPRFNRMAGVDSSFRFGFLSLGGFLARTVSPVGIGPQSGNEIASRANFNYQDRKWQFRGRFDAVGARFNDELGFIPRRGVNNEFAYIGRAFRARWFPTWLREVRPHWQADVFTRQKGNALDTRQQDFHVPFTFSNGSFMEVGMNSNLEIITAPFTLNPARRVRIDTGRYEYNEWFVFFFGNGAAKVTPSFRYSVGDFYNGTKRAFAVGPSFHPNEKFNGSVSVQVNDISLPQASYVSTLTAVRANYNFNTRVFVNALLQYTNDTHQLSSNIRFNIIHRPLSDFFFVYNDHRDTQAGLMQDRSLIAKLTYLVAF